MATISPSRPRRHAIRRPSGPAAAGRERRLAAARAREVEARQALARAIARMELAHARAARDLDAFAAYLDVVRKDLRHMLAR